MCNGKYSEWQGIYIWGEAGSGAQTFSGPFAADGAAEAQCKSGDFVILPASKLTPSEYIILRAYKNAGLDINGVVEVDLASSEELTLIAQTLEHRGLLERKDEDIEVLMDQLTALLPHMTLCALSNGGE
ncbi:hypothetical protein [Sphingomonas hankookensis]|uniref:hypothetical protein n=1 Tax=Sphingomonas hankookensis TaxID=563996 RepID=UPI00234E7C24|nr:hypothetical protein [Sphingomonas hankookensis]WCP72202.1 hypothetical protein PPZ50_01150 [Sphingomonas hankookensis]